MHYIKALTDTPPPGILTPSTVLLQAMQAVDPLFRLRWHPRAGRHSCEDLPPHPDGTPRCECDLGRWVVTHFDASGHEYFVLFVQDQATGARHPLDMRLVDRLRGIQVNSSMSPAAMESLIQTGESRSLEQLSGFGRNRDQVREAAAGIAKAVYNSMNGYKGYNVRKLNRDFKNWRQYLKAAL